MIDRHRTKGISMEIRQRLRRVRHWWRRIRLRSKRTPFDAFWYMTTPGFIFGVMAGMAAGCLSALVSVVEATWLKTAEGAAATVSTGFAVGIVVALSIVTVLVLAGAVIVLYSSYREAAEKGYIKAVLDHWDKRMLRKAEDWGFSSEEVNREH